MKNVPKLMQREIGFQLHLVQKGEDPDDWKPMTTIGSGVREIRIRVGDQYRVIYIAAFSDGIYVLHAFKKKTQKTEKSDLDIASKRLKAI
nr:type II toxin-antitoxin system RelE/ParE family toxin [uncultured Desulfobacter sp.]